MGLWFVSRKFHEHALQEAADRAFRDRVFMVKAKSGLKDRVRTLETTISHDKILRSNIELEHSNMAADLAIVQQELDVANNRVLALEKMAAAARLALAEEGAEMVLGLENAVDVAAVFPQKIAVTVEEHERNLE